MTAFRNDILVICPETESAVYYFNIFRPKCIFIICDKNHPDTSFSPRDARSAKRGIVIVGRPSVRPSVTLMYRGRIGWVTWVRNN